MTIPDSLTVTGLRTAVTRVLPHMAADWDLYLDVLMLDSDGTHLYVVATDKHTLAVGRAAVAGVGAAWSVCLGSAEADGLGRFLGRTDSRDPVTLRPIETGDETTLRVSGRHDDASFLTTGDHDFPDWRAVVAKALSRPVSDEPAALTLELLQRWAVVGGGITFHPRGASAPLLVTADDFIGLQMTRRRDTSDSGLDLWHRAVTGAAKAA
ncbi:hypothetical protein [Streptomyces luteireticuli]|uniref:DNA polymerase III beta sliding clamp central domain-containing protein n=1 Tax=Streptomyces luteireticuli TaxID=173858 RepID=A0ABP3IWN1_9ACTN